MFAVGVFIGLLAGLYVSAGQIERLQISVGNMAILLQAHNGGKSAAK
jgi:hypothetical protein